MTSKSQVPVHDCDEAQCVPATPRERSCRRYVAVPKSQQPRKEVHVADAESEVEEDSQEQLCTFVTKEEWAAVTPRPVGHSRVCPYLVDSANGSGKSSETMPYLAVDRKKRFSVAIDIRGPRAKVHSQSHPHGDDCSNRF